MTVDEERVVLALSGGVDSSVAAVLLLEAGYQVIGVTMQMWPREGLASQADQLRNRWASAMEDARKVANFLGIQHCVLDLKERFQELVIEPFCLEYGRGRTPNPCIRCNRHVKFHALLQQARELGAQRVATGHYARTGLDQAQGRYYLRRGVDEQKDQSYVLYGLSQEQLSQVIFPLENFSKEQVRRKADELGLPVTERPESQEICFIPGQDYGEYLRELIPELARPGPIVDSQGQVLGEHQGIAFYTIGQRKGLGISSPHPLYVLSIDAQANTVVVGEEKELYGKEILVSKVNWVSWVPPAEGANVEWQLQAKVRYRSHQASCLVRTRDEESIWARFDRPQRAITPGQSAVFYEGDSVVCGGIIESGSIA